MIKDVKTNVIFSQCYFTFINANVGIYLISYSFVIATNSIAAIEKGWITHGFSVNLLENSRSRKKIYCILNNVDSVQIPRGNSVKKRTISSHLKYSY